LFRDSLQRVSPQVHAPPTPQPSLGTSSSAPSVGYPPCP
jgi:hypothetical protein